LAHANHHTLVARSANDGREDGTWCVITGKSSFAHTGSIVDDKSGNIVVTHFRLLFG